MEPGQTYHIYNHANGDENLFREPDNYRFFLNQYRKHVHPVVDTFAYCLMPNHFHILIRVKNINYLRGAFPKFETLEKDKNTSEEDKRINYFISKQFANLFSSYTQAFNKMFNRKGSLFIKNFKRKTIDSDQQWQDTFQYIHHNPIKHGFAKSIGDWEWSSWKSYKKINTNSLLDRNTALTYFDDLNNLIYCSDERLKIIMAREFE